MGIAGWGLALVSAWGQDYRFPATEAQVELFYPTAYRDQGGLTDWSCADFTYAGHRGSDFGVGSWAGMEDGRDVVAAAEGVVIAATDGADDRCTTGNCDGGDGGYCGNHVEIRHPDGRSTVYCHLRRGSVRVDVGAVVACGDPLGQVGSSGWSTGPHLHFGAFDVDGQAYEPFAGACGAAESAWVDQGAYGGVPAPICDEPVGPCEITATLTCGDVWTGENDGAGSTGRHAWYQCTEGLETGPERMFVIRTNRDELVTVSVTGLTGDLDVFLLRDATCDGSKCLASSIASAAEDETMQFSGTAGADHHVLVEGYRGVVSPFRLEVVCDGRIEPPATTDAPEPVTDEVASVADSAVAAGEVVGAYRPLCGCAGAGRPGAAWGAAAAALLALRAARGTRLRSR